MDLPREFFGVEMAASSFRLLAYLWTFAGAGDRFVWPSRDLIVSECMRSDRTLRRALGELERLGLAAPDRQMRGSRVRDGWSLTLPSEAGIELVKALTAAPEDAEPANIGQARPTLAANGRDCARDPHSSSAGSPSDAPVSEHDPHSSSADAANHDQARPILARRGQLWPPKAANFVQAWPTLAALPLWINQLNSPLLT